MLLIIDNYDSFTFNLVQHLGELGAEPRVCRNDAADLAALEDMRPDYLVVSPGPGRPPQAGISVEAIRAFAGRVPILGVCLGHQCIAEAFGGRTVHAEAVMHGKTSDIEHDGRGVYAGMEMPLQATRYHSLVVERESLPECFVETSWTRRDDGGRGEVMGLRHRELAVEGVQFHPESILTPAGKQLLRNFLDAGAEARAADG